MFTQSAAELNDLLKINTNTVEKNRDDTKECASKTEVTEYRLKQIDE